MTEEKKKNEEINKDMNIKEEKDHKDKKHNKNIRKITVIPIPKIIVSVVPAQNDVAPKYIVHTKNQTNITI